MQLPDDLDLLMVYKKRSVFHIDGEWAYVTMWVVELQVFLLLSGIYMAVYGKFTKYYVE